MRQKAVCCMVEGRLHRCVQSSCGQPFSSSMTYGLCLQELQGQFCEGDFCVWGQVEVPVAPDSKLSFPRAGFIPRAAQQVVHAFIYRTLHSVFGLPLREAVLRWSAWLFCKELSFCMLMQPANIDCSLSLVSSHKTELL